MKRGRILVVVDLFKLDIEPNALSRVVQCVVLQSVYG